MKKIGLIIFLLVVSMTLLTVTACSKKNDGEAEKITAESGQEIINNGETTDADEKSESDSISSDTVNEETGNVTDSVTGAVSSPSSGNTSSSSNSGGGEVPSSGGKVPENSSGNAAIGDKSESSGESSNKDNITVSKGIDFKAINITNLEGTVNIEIEVVNSSVKNQDFDFSRIEIKTEDGKTVTHEFCAMTVKAGEALRCFFPIEDTSVDLSVGKKVSVYYEGVLLKTVAVEEF